MTEAHSHYITSYFVMQRGIASAAILQRICRIRPVVSVRRRPIALHSKASFGRRESVPGYRCACSSMPRGLMRMGFLSSTALICVPK